VEKGDPVIQLYKSATVTGFDHQLLASQKLGTNKNIQLKIEAKTDTYSFWFAEKKDKWVLLKDGVEAKFLSTEVAGGFVGSLFAFYGTSDGKVTASSANFDWFEYQGNDEVYKPLKE
jgi:alpha-N-arabinofuranosidase